MSVNLNITIRVSLNTIDQIRNGKEFWALPEAPKVQADATRAIIDAAINFPYEITPSPTITPKPIESPVPEPHDEGRFDIWIDLLAEGKRRLLRVTGNERIIEIARELHSSGDSPDMHFQLVYRGYMIYNGFSKNEMDPSNMRTLSSLEISQDAIIKYPLIMRRS